MRNVVQATKFIVIMDSWGQNIGSQNFSSGHFRPHDHFKKIVLKIFDLICECVGVVTHLYSHKV